MDAGCPLLNAPASFFARRMYLKVKLVNTCQNNPKDDGYEVVQKFLEKHLKIKENMQNYRAVSYGENKFEKYSSSPAV